MEYGSKMDELFKKIREQDAQKAKNDADENGEDDE